MNKLNCSGECAAVLSGILAGAIALADLSGRDAVFSEMLGRVAVFYEKKGLCLANLNIAPLIN
jgi:hypothetical protein